MSGVDSAQPLQHAQRRPCVVDIDEHVVVVQPGDHVAAESRVRKGGGECRGETDGVERGVHLERDPRPDEVVIEASSLGDVARDDDGEHQVLDLAVRIFEALKDAAKAVVAQGDEAEDRAQANRLVVVGEGAGEDAKFTFAGSRKPSGDAEPDLAQAGAAGAPSAAE